MAAKRKPAEPPPDPLADKQAMLAFQSRTQGYDYETIAGAFGITPQEASALVRRGVDLARAMLESADVLRYTSVARTQAHLQVFTTLAAAGNVKAGDLVIRLEKRLEELLAEQEPELGLDAWMRDDLRRDGESM